MSIQKKSIFFLGTPEFAVPSLRALLESDAFDVKLVITQPDKPVGRKQLVTPPPVKTLALEHGIPVFQPENLNSAWKDRPVKEQPDFLVVVAYGQILKQDVLDASKIAPVNVHASVLPRWRGASPLQHAILSGDTESGVTVQQIVKELDAGAILGKAVIELDPRETTETLHDKLSKLGAELLLRTLSEPLNPEEQDPSGVTLCRKLSRSDGDVDAATMTAEEIDRKVRALVPWPGVRMTIDGESLKILETNVQEQSDSFALPCAKNSTLYILKLQEEGRKPVTGSDWKKNTKSKSQIPNTEV